MMFEPWQVWLNGLNVSLRTKGWLVQFPVRAQAWVAGQVPSRGCVRGNHTLMFLSFSFFLPSPLSKNKKNKSFTKDMMMFKIYSNTVNGGGGSEIKTRSDFADNCQGQEMGLSGFLLVSPFL